uniref:Uncharacterized protein n=1 Tax=Moniliophthora roreri TaxID=221103 RepID=A0A0W0FI18_MONRR
MALFIISMTQYPVFGSMELQKPSISVSSFCFPLSANSGSIRVSKSNRSLSLIQLYQDYFCFFILFPIVSKLWVHPSFKIQQESLSLIQLYQDSWSAYPGPEEGDEQLAFIAALIKPLKQDHYSGHCSILLTSTPGQDFIQFIHTEIIRHKLYKCSVWKLDDHHREMLIDEWIAATRDINHLTPIPHSRAPAQPSIEIVAQVANENAILGQENSDSVEMDQLGTRPPDP